MNRNTTSNSIPTKSTAQSSVEKTHRANRAGRMVRTIGAIALAAVATVLPALPVSAQTAPTTTTAPVEQRLFAGSLWATMSIENIAGFTSPGFDGSLFSLTGPFAKTRGNVVKFHNFQATSLTTIQSASIEIQLTHAGWSDDQVALEYSVDGWRTAHQLTTFSGANPIPGALTALRFDGLRPVISTPALARSVEVRLRNVSAMGKVDVVSFKLDQVALAVSGS